MKVLIIDFRMFNGIGFQYTTQYYVDGRRVSRNSYYQMSTFIYDNFNHESTKVWSDTNKNGIHREYTEIIYKHKEKRI